LRGRFYQGLDLLHRGQQAPPDAAPAPGSGK
jgi:hypothetical protein